MTFFERAAAAVDESASAILSVEREIWRTPETGYKEWRTHEYLAEKFRGLGYKLEIAGDIPGFYTVVETSRPGPRILVLGELDSLICADHPECDRDTKAVHACGHNAQCAGIFGVAAALASPGISDSLCGSVMICAVPAEELIELGYRERLLREGKIRFFGGKAEFLARGYFDGVDAALMVHTSTKDMTLGAAAGSVGCIAKKIVYRGVASHAGGAPELGINALYAANLGLSAINALRETFPERDLIRVHPIITGGGNAVNAIPDEVTLESFVRGASVEAISRANAKINRALRGAAACMGANIEISDRAGYAPLVLSDSAVELAKAACEMTCREGILHSEKISTGSTDLGDISTVMPVMYIYAGGAVGKSHGSDYRIADPERACINAAKVQLALIGLLLENGAVRTKELRESFSPVYSSIAEYVEKNSLYNRDIPPIAYNGDGSIVL